MKKIVTLTVGLFCLISLISCNGSSEKDIDQPENQEQQSLENDQPENTVDINEADKNNENDVIDRQENNNNPGTEEEKTDGSVKEETNKKTPEKTVTNPSGNKTNPSQGQTQKPVNTEDGNFDPEITYTFKNVKAFKADKAFETEVSKYSKLEIPLLKGFPAFDEITIYPRDEDHKLPKLIKFEYLKTINNEVYYNGGVNIWFDPYGKKDMKAFFDGQFKADQFHETMEKTTFQGYPAYLSKSKEGLFTKLYYFKDNMVIIIHVKEKDYPLEKFGQASYQKFDKMK